MATAAPASGLVVAGGPPAGQRLRGRTGPRPPTARRGVGPADTQSRCGGSPGVVAQPTPGTAPGCGFLRPVASTCGLITACCSLLRPCCGLVAALLQPVAMCCGRPPGGRGIARPARRAGLARTALRRSGGGGRHWVGGGGCCIAVEPAGRGFRPAGYSAIRPARNSAGNWAAVWPRGPARPGPAARAAGPGRGPGVWAALGRHGRGESGPGSMRARPRLWGGLSGRLSGRASARRPPPPPRGCGPGPASCGCGPDSDSPPPARRGPHEARGCAQPLRLRASTNASI
jgi:hypothetical protein